MEEQRVPRTAAGGWVLCIQGPRVKLGWAKVSHPGLACLLGATWNLLGDKVELSCALRIQGCC